MTPDKLTSLLTVATHTDPPSPGPGCPDEHAIAAYVDGALGNAEREPLELHVADCAHCLALVGLLSREHSLNSTVSVPELEMARARALATPSARRRTFAAPRWAAAAVVLLTAAGLVRFAEAPRSNISESGSDAPRFRSGDSGVPSLRLLSPGDGTTVDRDRLSVRWTPMPGAHYYNVRVVTDAGDLVSEEQVTGTEWRPGSGASLHAGPQYFVNVEAFVSEGKSIDSEHVSFQVSD
jgi:hypothetical protein